MNQGIRSTSLKLAVFTAVTVVVTVWLASVIGNFRFFSGPYQVTAEFADATGLLRGDVVKAAGVTVGRVGDIRVEDGIARVELAIDRDVEIPAGVDAAIRFRNLVGQRMVVLHESAPAEGLLRDGDLIPLARTDPAFDLTVLFNGLRPLIRSTDPADINAVTRALGEALEGRDDEVEGILADLAAVGNELSRRDAALARMLENLDVVVEDLANRDTQLRRTLGNMHRFLASIAASRDDLSQALVTLDDAARRFRGILDRNDRNIEAELHDLAVILDAVNDKRRALRGAIRALPEMLVATQRVMSYGEWSMLHVVHVCKDDADRDCGRRVRP